MKFSMKSLLTLITLFTLFSISCKHAPPNLSPDAKEAFNKTRVIKTLDVLRDFAIDANAQTPSLVSTDVTRKVVEYHRSSLIIIHDGIGNGWRALVFTATDELIKNLPPNDLRLIEPYVVLIRAVIEESQR